MNRFLTPILIPFLTLALALLGLGHAGTASSLDYSELFSKVDPAVVVIATKEKSQRLTPDGIKQKKGRGLGSGVIVDSQGHILTASHVVDTADKIMVMTRDGKQLKAEVVAAISVADLALIRLLEPPPDLPFVAPGNSDAIDIGEEVFVIGSPYGLQHTLTVGHLSGRREQKGTPFGDLEFLQTDAAINKGNSGGPLFDSRGQLIGIVSHIRSQSGGNEGLGFAASTNMAKTLLLESPPVWLGADFMMLTEELAAALNAGQQGGMLVQNVARGSMADKLGVKPGYIPAEIGGLKLLLGGDIITSINGTTVSMTEQGLKRVIDNYRRVQPGDKLSLKVTRRGATIELTATAE